jgi:hypothetical protein
MRKDFGRFSVHINRHYLSNFALGFDYYQLNEQGTNLKEASILQLNFLVFNITFTRWAKWI